MVDTDKSSYVYTWTRPDTGEVFYVGLGSTKYRDVTPKRGNKIFMRIIAKLARLGLEPIIARIADNLTIEEARQIERSEIARIGRKDKGSGPLANLTDGGEGNLGWVPSAETRARISASNIGRVYGSEFRAKMSAIHKGRQKSAETCAKLSAAHKGKPKSAQHRAKLVGIPKSDEHRAKLSAAKMGKTPSLDTISKLCAGHRMSGPQSNNTSGYKGVSVNRRDGTWLAQIKLEKHTHLGTFGEPEAAARAYDYAAVEAWGLGNCYLNFPEAFYASQAAANDNDVSCERNRAA